MRFRPHWAPRRVYASAAHRTSSARNVAWHPSTNVKIGAHDLVRRPVLRDFAAVDQNRALAQPGRCHQVVRDEENRSAMPAHVAHFVEAFLLEPGVADGQDFVDQQGLGLQMSADGEREAQIHSTAVMLDRCGARRRFSAPRRTSDSPERRNEPKDPARERASTARHGRPGRGDERREPHRPDQCEGAGHRQCPGATDAPGSSDAPKAPH